MAVAGACSNSPAQNAGPISTGTSGTGTTATPTGTAGGGTTPPVGTVGAAGRTGAAGTGSVPPSTTAGTGAIVTAGTSATGAAGVGTTTTGTAGTGISVTAGTTGAAAAIGAAAGTSAPAAGTGGEVGPAGGAGGTAGPTTSAKPPCLKKDSQLVVLGDSYVNWASHQFQQNLAADSGVMFRTYAVGGVSMASGGIDPSNNIPQQFDKALREDKDILAVITDGGGNDILLADTAMYPGGDACKNSAMCGTIEVCKKIMDVATSTATTLMQTKFVSAGVQDVVYFYYPEVPAGTLLGGSNPVACLTYARPGAKAACDGSEAATEGKLRCHWLDLAPIFQGHNDWFAGGDIHPNSQGGMAMADAVTKLLKDNCIAQPESSGCCTP